MRSDLIKQLKAKDEMINKLREEIMLLSEFENKYLELKRKQGMSRETLSCDNWHHNNKKACNEMYGFPDFDQLKVFLRCMFEEFSEVHN